MSRGEAHEHPPVYPQPVSSPPNRRTTNQFSVSPFLAALEEQRLPASSSSLAGMQRLIFAEDLSVVFQPIVRMDSFEIFAYEALVRCRLEAFLDPTELFRRAVEENCTGRLGRLIREVAVPLCSGVPLFLNVHPVEMRERWLVRPDDPLNFHDHHLYLEVTESVPFEHFNLCNSVLRELRARTNVLLVVDDLGAGYSNLGRILELEPRVVKLDRSLIMGVTQGTRQQKLVAGVVRLCVEMGADVVAEGIETMEELEALSRLGIHYGQGYLFARPGFPLPTVDAKGIRAQVTRAQAVADSRAR